MNIREILNDAANLIDDYGWVQGENGTFALGFCAYGAVCYVARHSDQRWPALLTITDHVNRLSVVDWNDSYCWDKQEVIDTLRNAAKDIEDNED